MSEKENNGGKKVLNDGYVPVKRGYQPNGGKVTGGHTPEKSELRPVSPPKKK